jgi:hypothetical protein
MSLVRFRFVLSALPAAALMACGGGGDQVADAPETAQAAKPGSATQTAQAIWSNFGAASSEIIVAENRKFDYEESDFCQGTDVSSPDSYGNCPEGTSKTAGAASYFGTPTVTGAWSCSGSQANCDSSNQPASLPTQPAAPMHDLLDQAKCALWWGEVLPTLSTTVRSSTVNGTNGRGNWTYTWTFTAEPLTTTDAVAAHSAYGYKVLGDAGTVDVALDGYVYGESAQSLTKGTRKYSFSMRASDGSVRVVNTVISISKNGLPYAAYSEADGTLAKALQENLQANNNYEPINFFVPAYLGTSFLAIRNYELNLLTFGAQARDILNNTNNISLDNFAGNDNGGTDGSALARVKLMPATPVSFDAGLYAVTYTGQVKELNADGTLQGFTVTRTINIVGEPGTCKRN